MTEYSPQFIPSKDGLEAHEEGGTVEDTRCET